MIACKSPLQPFAATCKSDGEITAQGHESIDEVALKFVQDALGLAPSEAYRIYTDDAKASVPLDRFAASFREFASNGPYKDLRVAHTYLVKLTGGTQDRHIVCGNLADPNNSVMVIAEPGNVLAHVIIEGKADNNSINFVVSLISEQVHWRVQYVHYALVAIAGRSARDLQRMAIAQDEKHHIFNTFILYTAAFQLTDRGPNLELGIRPEIQRAVMAIQSPPDLRGRAPYIWTYARSTFKILTLEPVGIDGKLYLRLDQEIEPWKDGKQADRRNRALIRGFTGAHPEYRDVFAGLIVRAHERGGSREFKTIEGNEHD